MSKHLSQEQLLRHLDGELSPFAGWKAASHLKTCWACQVELDHLKERIAAIVDAQSLVSGPALPPPPRPWARLEPRLERASAEAVPAWRGIAPFGAKYFKSALACGVAALALAVVVVSLWFSAPPVFAKDVLARVTTADGKRLAVTNRHVARQRVRIVKTSRSAAAKTARVASWSSSKATYWESGEPVGAELLERYASCGLSSALPLSPMSMQTWVQAAGTEPSATRDRGSIRVEVASQGAGRAHGLERVSLRIKEEDWHLDEMTLAFADATYQITEEESGVVAREQVPADVMAHLDPVEPATGTTAAPEAVSVPAASPVNLDDLEMGVRYDLHQIGADLDEAIEITPRPPDRLRVEALQVSPKTRERLTALLGNKPGVQLDFAAPSSAARTPAATNIVTQAGGSPAPADARLAAYFGSAEAQENYTRLVLEASDTLLSHLYALQELATRWPEDQEPRLSASARSQLDAMVRDHALEVEKVASGLHRELAPLLEHFGLPMSEPASAQARVPWREGARTGLDAALRVNRVLRSLLTTSDSPLTTEQAFPRLRKDLDDLRKIAVQL